MTHTSVRLSSPIEFVNIVPVNPLISKCEIKVCYVSNKPNRNGSIITKEVATQLAQSLPGSPIVGYYTESKKDFEEHNRVIKITNGEFVVEETTKPYGFVDLNAKVWFAKYLDDESVEREYLVTEGWLWTGQYPECKRIVERGNNHSMELDQTNVKGTWTTNDKGLPEFFIINEAIISKLCILGEDCEPCFEGSTATAPTVNFSFSAGFEQELKTMMQSLADIIQKGGQKKMFNKYSVAVGDNVWNSVYNYLRETYPSTSEEHNSIYRIAGVYEEEEQKFVVLQNYSDANYYRLNVNIAENSDISFGDSLIEITSSYEPEEEPQFNSLDIEEYEKNLETSDNSDESIIPNSDNSSEGNVSENNNNEDVAPAVASYSLNDIPEYVELQNKYSALEQDYNTLLEQKNALETQLNPLVEFKKAAEKKEKEALIDSFYMLSDEDKKNVIENIDTYSLRDIEAELSILCVRNKVSFDIEEPAHENNGPTTYSLNDAEEDNTPAWVKRVMSVAKTLN